MSQELSLLELKKPISGNDHPALLNHVRELYCPEGTFQYEFSNLSLSKEMVYFHDKILTEKDLLAAIDRLKKDSTNVYDLLLAGNALKAINRHTEAQKYYSKALDITVKQIKESPKDAGLYQKAGNIYSAMNNQLMMILSYEKAIEIDPKRDTVANVMLPIAYLNAGFLIKLKEHTSNLLEKYPDSTFMHVLYFFGPLFNRMSTGFDFGPKSAEQFFSEYSIYTDYDSSYLHQSLLRNPNNIELLQLQHGAEMYALLFESFNTYDFENHKISLSEKSLEKVEEHRLFFQSVIKKKKSNNLFFSNYSLGILAVMENKNKLAIQYFEKAIQQFPSDKFSFQFNPAGCYESIIYAHLAMGDTLAAEKSLDNKMKNRPSLYENPADYYTKACYRLHDEDLINAKKFADKSIEIDSSFSKANLLNTYFLLEEKNYKKAQQDLEKLYDEFKDNFNYNFTYAVLLLLQNDASTSKVFFSKAISLSPEDKAINRILDTYFKMP